jgi:S1-C subfamily serine protease
MVQLGKCLSHEFYREVLSMQFTKKSPASLGWLGLSSRFSIILGFVCVYLLSFTAFAPQVSAASLSAPGGQVSDPAVRQVDIARPAVVRIITTLRGRLTVTFTATTPPVTFPLTGGSYPVELSGTGAFISAHGDILTADHVVNPPRDQSLNDVLYQEAADDIANYINTHFQVTTPFTPQDVVIDLEVGAFPSRSSFAPPTSRVYLSTSYTGQIRASRVADIPSSDFAEVDSIKAQSSVDAADVAIIHVSGMDNMPSIQVGDSSQVAELDNLTVIGFPGNGDFSSDPTDLLTSSINKVYVSALKTSDTNPVIEVGGNVEHGDSGGPALDANGNIVGIVSFGLASANDPGQTAFLQASNSARTLIQNAGIDTTPGSFEQAWTQAFNDYSSTSDGHWHKAYQELQDLANTNKSFLAVTPYLNYAQSQLSNDSASPLFNPVLIVGLILLVLVLIGIVLFAVLRRRGQLGLARANLAGTGAVGAYPPPTSGVYPPTPASYGSGVYPAAASAVTPSAYSPTPAGYGSGVYPAAAPAVTPSVYPPTPASYANAAWYEQAAGQPPQTPPLSEQQTPLPSSLAQSDPTFGNSSQSVPSVSTASTENVELAQEATQTKSVGNSLPTWTTPELSPVDDSYSNLLIERANLGEPTLLTNQLSKGEPTLLMEPSSEGEPTLLVESPSEGEPTLLVESPSEGEPTLLVEPSPEGEPTLLTNQTPEGEPTLLMKGSPEEDATLVTNPATENPLPLDESVSPPVVSEGAESSPYMQAPCGHLNAPDARFCRVCGQRIPPVGEHVS